MLTLQTVYSCGINDRADDECIAEKDNRVVGNMFCFYHCIVYIKVQSIITFKNELDNSFLKQNFFKILSTHFGHNLKDAGYFVRVSVKFFKSIS